jgi:hypothetical protein
MHHVLGIFFASLVTNEPPATDDKLNIAEYKA